MTTPTPTSSPAQGAVRAEAASAGAYPIVLNGDHAEFEAEWAGRDPKTRPDWPLPSFDAQDWSEAFCKVANAHGFKDAEGKPIDEGWMTSWFANSLMRGFDEARARAASVQEAAPAKEVRDHTEMPWTAFHRTDHDCGNPDLWEIHWSKDGECVAEVVHEEADAHLIAAAPSLAACCEALLALMMGGVLLNSSSTIVQEQRVKIAAMRALLNARIDFGPQRDPFAALDALSATSRQEPSNVR